MKLWNKAFDQGYLDREICDVVFSGYNSSVDFPSSAFYRDLIKIYPNSRVILTTRDSNSWIKSVRKTTFRNEIREGFRLKFFFWIMGMSQFSGFFTKLMFHAYQENFEKLKYDDEVLKKAHDKYDQNVRDIVPKERLLEFKSSDGWEPLCKFLNLPVPDEPYPWENTTVEFNERMNKEITHRFFRLGAILTIISLSMGIICKRFFKI